MSGSKWFALTHAQRRLYYADRVTGETGAYNIPLAWRVTGPLDGDVLERALNALLQRHAALRTRCADVDGEPMQQLLPEARLSLRRLPAQANLDADALAQAVMRQEAMTPFQLDRELPLRAALLSLGAGEAVFLLTIHHLVFDGWSMGLLLHELGTVYEALRRGVPPRLHPLPLQYEDYLAQQSLPPSSGNGAHMDDARAYWQAQLDGAQTLELPTDRRRSDVLSFESDCHHFDLDPQLVQAVRALAAARGTTFFTLLASCLQVQLHRYTGQTDICIGYPVSNRGEHHTQWLVGCFINTLVLRSQVHPRGAFAALLQQVAATINGGRQHESFDLATLQVTSPVRVLLNLNPNDQPPLELAGTQAETLRRISTAAPFDLALILAEHSGHVRGRLEYNTSLFDRQTVERFGEHFRTLLRAVLDDPDGAVGHLPLLSAEHARHLLADCNGPPAGTVADADVYRLFDIQAQLQPLAPAILGGAHPVSYAEVSQKASMLAARLAASGARPERAVAVMLERGPGHVIALLAVLKCGATYVPIDASAPASRTSGMMDELAPAVLLTQPAWQNRFDVQGMRVLLLDEDGTSPAEERDYLPARTAIHPQQLAYCIYTSGSTGQPKAVMVPYAALADHVHTSIATYAIAATDRVLQFAATSFDTSIEQMLAPLCAGASVLVRPEQLWTPEELLREVTRHRISIADIPVSYWQTYTAAEGRELVRTDLRLLLTGGEPVLSTHQLDLKDGMRALNVYGPTETTVTCSLGELVGARSGTSAFVPIGRPLANTRLYILDTSLQLLPVGVEGEIYIAGLRVGRGYLGRPDLTAAQFVPDPFGESGSRMYRSGDRGRHLPDGSIEFTGRKDQQVKVRGFRIELGDVEHALLQAPGVLRAAVCVERDDEGDNRLVAFMVRDVPACSARQVREHLHGLLPAYMMPAEWVFLDALPLTSSGKIDRKQLLAMPRTAAEADMRAVPSESGPGDPILAGVLAITLRIAGTEDVQVDDDLIENSGFHSMQLVRMAAQCSSEFGCRVSVRDIAKGRTVEGIAHKIRHLQQATS